MSIHKIFIVVTQTGTRISKAIQFFSHDPYNHASITSDNELKEMFSFCRTYLRLPLPAGFKSESIEQGIFSIYPSIPCEIYSLEVNEKQYQSYNDIIKSFKENSKIFRYNVLGLFAMAFNIPIKRETSFVCSQFVAHVLNHCDIIKFKKNLSLIRPNDLRHLPGSQLIYKGDIKQYHSFTKRNFVAI